MHPRIAERRLAVRAEEYQCRQLTSASLVLAVLDSGSIVTTAERAVLSIMHHGVSERVRAMAEEVRRQYGIVAPGFQLTEEERG